MDVLIKAVMREVPSDDARFAIYSAAIKAFEDNDCDTLGECLDSDAMFDAALRKANPDVYDDEEEAPGGAGG